MQATTAETKLTGMIMYKKSNLKFNIKFYGTTSVFIFASVVNNTLQSLNENLACFGLNH